VPAIRAGALTLKKSNFRLSKKQPLKLRYFAELSYCGTRFSGWQKQARGVTVQSTLEEAFSKVLREEIKITGAGRTDTGVHAAYYVAHFECDEIADSGEFVFKMNRFLPESISLRSVKPVRKTSHARFDAISRTYRYVFMLQKNPFLTNLCTYYYGPLNTLALAEASALLLQNKDYTTFSKLHSNNKTNLCEVSLAEWTMHGTFLVFTLRSDRFLRNMVRAITGALTEVARNKMSVEEFRGIMLARDRSLGAQTAPAEGLYLCDIAYPADYGMENPGKHNPLPFELLPV
jgi:tRNA pseudouridine38-40 synthase